MGTDNFFLSASPAPDFIIGSVSSFVAGFVPNSVSVDGVIVGRVALVIIGFTKDNYFYKEKITIKNFTSFKLYIKEIILNRRVLFSKTSKA